MRQAPPFLFPRDQAAAARTPRGTLFGAKAFLPWVLVFLLWGSIAAAAEVTLAWDPNSEADLEGYGVYLSRGIPGPPYELYGYVALSELENAAAPRFTVTDLEKGARYYFAVTAYDTEGYESYFSRPACADVGDTIMPCPASSSSGGSGGGGGGGGGGCFLQATTPQHGGPGEGFFLFIPLLSILVGLLLNRGSRA